MTSHPLTTPRRCAACPALLLRPGAVAPALLAGLWAFAWSQPLSLLFWGKFLREGRTNNGSPTRGKKDPDKGIYLSGRLYILQRKVLRGSIEGVLLVLGHSVPRGPFSHFQSEP